MRELLPYLINGISVGGQYALIAIGYTLVYGILRLINFAHGDVFMVAGLVMVYATTAMPFYVALPLVLIATVILGFTIERVAYKPLRSAPRMSVMISAIGVSYLIQNLSFYITGGVPQPVTNPIPWISENVSLLGASTKRVTLVTPALTIGLGFFIERAAYKPLRRAPRMSVMISAIGVSYLLQNTATYVTGGQPMTYPAINALTKTINIAGASTKLVVIITPVLVLVLILLLTTLINHTKIGMAMRAVSKDFETSRLMGIKINNVISMTFVIGSALAVVGSILYFTTYPAITPTAGAMPGLKSFVAAVFGGIGSIPGAVIGAFLIGICETIIKGLPSSWNVSVFSDAFTFALLIVILTCKPTGLFGEKATDKV